MKHHIILFFILTTMPIFTHAQTDRFIPFERIENGRDLGGLVMQDGRRIKPYRLVRSGNLSRASDADVAILTERFALSNVYDFRFDAEVGGAQNRQIAGVSYTRLSTLPKAFIESFSSGRTDTTQIKSADVVDLLATYAFHPQAQEMARRLYPTIVMDTTSQRLYGDFLRGVLRAEGGVLWHCSQGKDRAGWATAFLLAALGADRKTIVEDFDLSNRFYAPVIEKLSARIAEKGGGEAEQDFIGAMVGVSVKTFESALDLIDQHYGSLANYLAEALNFSTDEQQRLRDKYLTQ